MFEIIVARTQVKPPGLLPLLFEPKRMCAMPPASSRRCSSSRSAPGNICEVNDPSGLAHTKRDSVLAPATSTLEPCDREAIRAVTSSTRSDTNAHIAAVAKAVSGGIDVSSTTTKRD